MTVVPINRRCLGWFLLIGAPLMIALFVFVFDEVWSGSFTWPLLILAALGLGFASLVYQYVVNPPVLAIGDGYFEIYRWPLRSVRIPLKRVKQARIREPYAGDGNTYFLEVTLDAYTTETEPWKDTIVKRETVKLVRKFGGYQPPPEPYLVLQTPLMGVSDAELCAIVEKERGQSAVAQTEHALAGS